MQILQVHKGVVEWGAAATDETGLRDCKGIAKEKRDLDVFVILNTAGSRKRARDKGREHAELKKFIVSHLDDYYKESDYRVSWKESLCVQTPRRSHVEK